MVTSILTTEMQQELQRELTALVRESHEELKALVHGTLKEAVQEELTLRVRSSDEGVLSELRCILREHRASLPGRSVEELSSLSARTWRPTSMRVSPQASPRAVTEESRSPRAAPVKRVHIVTEGSQAQKGELVLPGIVTPPVECSSTTALTSVQDAGSSDRHRACSSECSSDAEPEAGHPEQSGAGRSSSASHASPLSSYPSTPRERGSAQPSNIASEGRLDKLGRDPRPAERASGSRLPSLLTAVTGALRSSFGRLTEVRLSEQSSVHSLPGRGCHVWQESGETPLARPGTPGSEISVSAPPSNFSATLVRPDTTGTCRPRTLIRDSPGPRVTRISIVHGLKRRSSEWKHVVTYESIFMLLRSNIFDYTICAVLFLNALSIGMQVDYGARHLGEVQPEIFKHLEVAFCFVFLVELLLRLYVYRTRFFVLPHGRWNLLDLIVVVVQVFEVIMMWIFEDANVNLPNLKILRFLRLIRILRLLRLINVIQELNKMVYLILGSLWSFLWTTALLMLMTLVGGVFFTQLVADHLNGSTGSSTETQELAKFYGSLGDTILSLLAATTGGVDWMDVLRPLMQSMPSTSFLLALLFLLYIAFSVLVVMNLVTGVFVDGAKRLTNLENESALLKKVQRAFVLTDMDNSQMISWPEFRMHVDSPFMKDFFNSVDIEQSQAATLFSLLDHDNTFSLSAEEFVQGCLRLRGPAKVFDLAALQHESRSQNRMVQARLESLESALRQLSTQMGKEAGRQQRGTSGPPLFRLGSGSQEEM